MKLHQKLLLGFACGALLVCCVGYVAQQMNRSVEQSVLQLSEVAVHELSSAGEMAGSIREAIPLARSAAAAAGSPGHQEAVAAFEKVLVQFEMSISLARSATNSGRNRGLDWGRADVVAEQNRKLGWLETAAAHFIDFRIEAARLMASPAPVATQGVETVLEPMVQQLILPQVTRYREAAREGFASESGAVREQLVRADRFLFVAVLLGIGMTLVLGVLISNSISAPLLLLAEATRAIGRGRLDHRVTVRSGDEVAELGDALNRMVEELGHSTVSRQFMDSILASMSDPLFVLDHHARFILINGAGAATLGYVPAELEGRSVGAVLEDGEAGAAWILEQVTCHGGTGNVEMQLVTREGAALPFVFTGVKMKGEEDEAVKIVCVAKDISPQKQVELELRVARERAEEMARMKSSFLANMSHEIRTPLTGIIGSAQVLGEVVDGEAEEMAHIIEGAGVRLLATINSVLDMARIEAGELLPASEPLHLIDEVRDCVSVLRRLADSRHITLRVTEKDRGVWVMADPGFIHRIVVNLVGNAIKFTDEGGIEISVERDAGEAILRVVDTGIGMDASFLPHLFEEFRQESTGLQRSYEGTGLGLAITKRLVDLMGAGMSVESVKGEGTAFTVRLPATVAPYFEPVASRLSSARAEV